MTRLTNTTKDQILDELLKHKFSDLVHKMVEKQSEFAIKVYNDVFDRKTREKMRRLPISWLPDSSDISVEFAGKFVRLDYNGGNKLCWDCRYAFKKPLENIKKKKPYGFTTKQYEALHPLALEYTRLINERDDLLEAVNHAKSNARSALESVTTVEKLIKNWKEIEPFAKKYVEVKGVNLPALPTEQLNKLLNLPVGK